MSKHVLTTRTPPGRLVILRGVHDGCSTEDVRAFLVAWSRVMKPANALSSGQRSDEPEDLADLYRQYAAWLGRALRRRFGPAVAAISDDVVHDTYIRLQPYQQAAEIRHPKALLLRVASNLAYDRLRQAERSAALPGRMDGDHVRADAETDQEQVILLKQVVLSLPPKQRDVFMLSRFAGLTYAQIAERLQISIKTVESRMSQALLHCARRLGD